MKSIKSKDVLTVDYCQKSCINIGPVESTSLQIAYIICHCKLLALTL